LPKGPSQLDERVPIEVGTVQVNFCKNPQCQNFSIPVSSTRQNLVFAAAAKSDIGKKENNKKKK